MFRVDEVGLPVARSVHPESDGTVAEKAPEAIDGDRHDRLGGPPVEQPPRRLRTPPHAAA